AIDDLHGHGAFVLGKGQRNGPRPVLVPMTDDVREDLVEGDLEAPAGLRRHAVIPAELVERRRGVTHAGGRARHGDGRRRRHAASAANHTFPWCLVIQRPRPPTFPGLACISCWSRLTTPAWWPGA